MQPSLRLHACKRAANARRGSLLLSKDPSRPDMKSWWCREMLHVPCFSPSIVVFHLSSCPLRVSTYRLLRLAYSPNATRTAWLYTPAAADASPVPPPPLVVHVVKLIFMAEATQLSRT